MSVELLEPSTDASSVSPPFGGPVLVVDQPSDDNVSTVISSSARRVTKVQMDAPTEIQRSEVTTETSFATPVSNGILASNFNEMPTHKSAHSDIANVHALHEAVSPFEGIASGRAEGPRRYPGWVRQVRRRVMLVDGLAIYASVFVAFLLRWGMAEFIDLTPIQLDNDLALTAIALMAAWYVALIIADAWDVKLMGAGPSEYARVWNATFGVFGLLAIAAYLTRWDLARSFVAIALPLGLVLLGLSRWLMRLQLLRERENGQSMSSALMISSAATAEHLIKELAKAPVSGLRVVALCTPGSSPEQDSGTNRPRGETQEDGHIRFQAHLHSLDDVVPFIAEHELDAVIVSGSDELNPQVVKRLAWALEPYHVDLVLAPELTDVSGRRTVTRHVAGLSLLHVDEPGYTSSQQRLKRVFDFFGSVLLIAIFSVPLVVTALLVKLTSSGPILFRQNRIGECGKSFRILKFRSMYTGAEKERDNLDDRVGLYVKPISDPRITPFGKFIRRFSIDELPQLFNVLFGSMSLVGPRPFIPEESRLFSDGLERRVYVKPGMTGLWQVSGRSNLSEEESMALDLYYVENWSMTEDIVILAKTAKAVLGRDGAY